MAMLIYVIKSLETNLEVLDIIQSTKKAKLEEVIVPFKVLTSIKRRLKNLPNEDNEFLGESAKYYSKCITKIEELLDTILDTEGGIEVEGKNDMVEGGEQGNNADPATITNDSLN